MNTKYLWAAYGLLNVAAFLLFLQDKWRAKRRKRRTSESTLLTAALLGPFGAFLAMWLFRHKTRKRKFLLVPLAMFVHAIIIAFLIGYLCSF
ncbi:MAG: DUF1294 domain-containing protein [Euryarchaeota archaeon]|nr:DUF1294 domain-containing protein [Euryarchaeota archaeon]